MARQDGELKRIDPVDWVQEVFASRDPSRRSVCAKIGHLSGCWAGIGGGSHAKLRHAGEFH
jgi:hypothetical protein